MTFRQIRNGVLSVSTILVAFSTLSLLGMVVMDRVRDPEAGPERPPPELLDPETWRALSTVGHRLGPADAEITVVTFSDFECPMCGTFATRTFPAFQAEHEGNVALVYRHWPLSRHRFAYPAARASECAAAQGRFFKLHDIIYEQQRSLGLKTFREFADEAGVPDLEAFVRCISDSDRVGAIERDIRAVQDIGGTGTPTVIVNGWLLKGGVGPALLDSIARHATPSFGG